MTRVDYGNGVTRLFSDEQIRFLKRAYQITCKTDLRDLTRVWAESMPDEISVECSASRFGRAGDFRRKFVEEAGE